MARFALVGCMVLAVGLTGCKAKMEKVGRGSRSGAQQSAVPNQGSARQNPSTRPTSGDQRIPRNTRESGADISRTDVPPPNAAAPQAPAESPTSRASAPPAPESGNAPPALPARNRLNPNAGATQAVMPATADSPDNCVTGEGQPVRPPAPKKDFCKQPTLSVDKNIRTLKNLDVVLVVDTSASLTGPQGELFQVAKAFRSFVAQIPEANFNIAVILGHGPATRYHGALYDGGGVGPVLKFGTEYDKAAKEIQARNPGIRESDLYEKARELATSRISAMLEKKMLSISKQNGTTERGGAEGEAMLMSLYAALSDSAKLSKARQQGIFRPDSKLNVMFVTDEQDVCFDYEKAGITPLSVVKNGKDIGWDPPEKKFFHDMTKMGCGGAVLHADGSRSRLTPNHVYDALKHVLGYGPADKETPKLILSAITYSNPATLKAPGSQDENELGYGIVDIVKLGSGFLVDLGEINRGLTFDSALTQLGQFVEIQKSYKNSFACRTNFNVDSIDTSTINMTLIRNGAKIGSFHSVCAPDQKDCSVCTSDGKNCSRHDGPITMKIMQNGRNGAAYPVMEIPAHKLEGIIQRERNIKDPSEVEIKIEFLSQATRDTRTGKLLPACGGQ